MINDFPYLIQWWVTLFILGVGFLPLSTYLFSSFWDKGYAFSKILGLIIISYLILILGTIHLVPFTIFSLIAIFIFSVTSSIKFVSWRTKQPIKEILTSYKKYLHILIVEELLFIIVLLAFSYIRSFSPDINGLEKFMDYGFINSILRTDFFPPKDMWLTPFSINYYYFGHLQTAVLTKLSFLPSSITYNLMVATVAGLCFTATFSIATTLYGFLQKNKHYYQYVIAGILAGVIVTFAGNLHTLYSFFSSYPNEKPVPIWNQTFQPTEFPNAYWYPNATRFIHNTIHEFPMYSWTVADLHGHVLDIPNVLLVIAFILSLFLLVQNKKESTFKQKKSKTWYGRLIISLMKFDHTLVISIPYLLFTSFLLAVLYMTNAWDGIIYALLVLLLLFFLYWKNIKEKFFKKIIYVILDMTIPAAILIGGFFIFSLPFSFFFKPFVSGIGIICAPDFLTNIGKFGPLLFEADHCQQSPWWQLLTLYGFFYFFVVIFLAFLAKTKKFITSDIFILLLIILSTMLIIIPEFVYAKDIYPAHYRANTMFKLVFQSFIMLGISSAYIISRLITYLKTTKNLVGLLSLIVFFLSTLALLTFVLIYPYFSINSYYGELKMYKGLRGTSYLQTKYPSDNKAIEWFNNEITGQPVILEAQGDSYTDYARISSNTGLPTVLGWTVHEWLWRGSYDVPSPRIEEVKKMYESADNEETKNLIQKYHVAYVFIGDLEREKYPQLNEKKFEKLGTVVYRNQQTKVIKID